MTIIRGLPLKSLLLAAFLGLPSAAYAQPTVKLSTLPPLTNGTGNELLWVEHPASPWTLYKVTPNTLPVTASGQTQTLAAWMAALARWTAAPVSALSDMLAVNSGTLTLAGTAVHEKYVLSISGTLTGNTQYWTVPIVDPVTIPASWLAPASAGACSTPSASIATVLTVSYVRSGVTTTIGTVTFNSGATAAVLVGPGLPMSLLAGDLLIATTGASVDSTLANVGFTMTATKD